MCLRNFSVFCLSRVYLFCQYYKHCADVGMIVGDPAGVPTKGELVRSSVAWSDASFGVSGTSAKGGLGTGESGTPAIEKSGKSTKGESGSTAIGKSSPKDKRLPAREVLDDLKPSATSLAVFRSWTGAQW
jgi:hypothetical protein